MKKTLIIGAIILIAIAGVWFLKSKGGDNDIVLERPWVEIVSASLTEVDTEGVAVRELQTGDELADGTTLKTDAAGEAIIHFPDGSEARLDPNTTVVIEKANYNNDDSSLVVRLSLSAGRVWSKVISLSTPESEWRVDTANAVATVRGTAFGTEYLNGDSNFVGSENNVGIKAKNPDTGEEVDGTETELTQEDIIELKKDAIRKIVADKTPLLKKKIDAENREDFKNWINKQKERDEAIQKRLEALRESGLSDSEAKIELRQEIREQFIEKIIEQRQTLLEANLTDDGGEENTENIGDTFIGRILIPQVREKIVEALIARGEREAALKVKALSDAEIAALLERFLSGDLSEVLSNETKFQEIFEGLIKEYGGQQTQPIDQTSPSGSTGTTASKITSIKITSDVSFANPIVEGKEVRMKALAVMSDGTTLDVTSKAKWQVVGPVGQITLPGVFSATLSPEVAELGESFGSVTAVFEGEGGVFLGKTPIFKVVPQTPVSEDDRG